MYYQNPGGLEPSVVPDQEVCNPSWGSRPGGLQPSWVRDWTKPDAPRRRWRRYTIAMSPMQQILARPTGARYSVGSSRGRAMLSVSFFDRSTRTPTANGRTVPAFRSRRAALLLAAAVAPVVLGLPGLGCGGD